jgi:putative heme-binding domain-containing protein
MRIVLVPIAVAALLSGLDVSAQAPLSKEQYASFAMTHGGDASRGKLLFMDEKRLACGRCHSIDGKGGKVGPDLFAIGDNFGRRELVESVLAPSATIAEGYATTIVTTNAGDVFDGIIKESTDDAVTLMAADAQLKRIATVDVRERRVSAVSMMPEGLQNGLSSAEFADLIEYLASLKTPEATAAIGHGMPALIAETKRPVVLRPIHSAEHKFAHPVWFGPVPGVAGGFAVVEHETGKVWLLEKPGEAGEAKTLFFDSGRAMAGAHGIMAIVFHPKYSQNRRYFIVRQPVEKGRFSTQVFEGLAAPDLRADSRTPLREILKIDGSTSNHCGGGLEFGPDGYLYIAMGDSGPQQDPHGNAQDMSLLRGKMLRIDVDHADEGKAYAVPPDNPFVGRKGVRPEIWAAGLREPWRYSFDPMTGDLWVGDVGQDLYEEVDIVHKGENYGWNVHEGFAPFSNQYRRPRERYSPPVFAYGRKYGVSVTGGYVYRAVPKSPFYGVYLFADFQSRRIFGLTHANGVLKTVRQIGMSPERIVSFGRDERGALYVVGYEGTIFKLDLTDADFE